MSVEEKALAISSVVVGWRNWFRNLASQEEAEIGEGDFVHWSRTPEKGGARSLSAHA